MKANFEYEPNEIMYGIALALMAIAIAGLLLLIAGLVNENKACAGLGSITSNTLTSTELESRLIVNITTSTKQEEIESNGNYTIIKLTKVENVSYYNITIQYDTYSVRVKSFTRDCIEPPKELGEILSVNWEKRRDDCTYTIKKTTLISSVLMDSVIRENGDDSE